jgi:heterotetrameric sarcosine oxidase gamma subunit
MPDRSVFWSPVPGWSGALLQADGLQVSAREPACAWQLSGDSAALLARIGVGCLLGPRDRADGERYALRLAPDSVLLINDSALDPDAGAAAQGIAISELSDGIVCIDIEGPRAGELMALGSEYPFASPPGAAGESARLLFAGLRVAVVRRGHGWRLHVERPWAAALWHWLAAHAG